MRLEALGQSGPSNVNRLKAKQLMTAAAEAVLRGDPDTAEKAALALRALQAAGLAINVHHTGVAS
jgi:hypothetical protein